MDAGWKPRGEIDVVRHFNRAAGSHLMPDVLDDVIVGIPRLGSIEDNRFTGRDILAFGERRNNRMGGRWIDVENLVVNP